MSDGLAAATAIVPDPTAPGTFVGDVPAGWDIAGNTNGGVLLALAARSLALATGRPDPVSITGHFTAPGRPGPHTIVTSIVKSGRRFATGTATVQNDGRTVLTAIATLGTLEPTPAPLHVDGGPPELPDPDDCPRTLSDASPPFLGRIDLRIHPDDLGWTRGAPTGVPRLRGWFRLLDGEAVDPVALVVAADAFPPTVFNASLPIGWTPTLELTVHLRARPVPGWLACAVTTRFVTGDLLEVDGEIWDAGGTLVAQSRQLALVARV